MNESSEWLLPVLTCPHCGKQSGFAAATGKLTAGSAPDPIDARCPHCDKRFRCTGHDIKRIPVSRAD